LSAALALPTGAAVLAVLFSFSPVMLREECGKRNSIVNNNNNE